MNAYLLQPATLKRATLAATVLLMFMSYLYSAIPAAALQPGNQHFQRTWERTDRPVQDGLVARTWMWGPEAFTDTLQESYEEAPDGKRAVQYYDKARMEITSPDADSNSIWYVTNGLLVVELITGNVQVGNDSFEQRDPALTNVAGDADDPSGPTYASFGALTDDPPQPLNAAITARVDRSGNVSSDPTLAAQGVVTGHIDEVTHHAIAAPFWDFMNSNGTVFESGQFVSRQLFENAYFATGRPITEAYWAEVKVGGQYRDVLMQCFERRCLTYTPGNPEGFIVEAGNVGQHYHAWRYAEQPDEEPEPTPTPTEPAPTPTATATATEPPSPTATAQEPTPTQEPTATATEEPSPTPAPATDYEFVNTWGGRSDEDATISDPTDVAVASNGNAYVVDKLDRVQVFDPDGVWIKSWGSEGAEPGQFNDPEGIAVDHAGDVYVADYGNQRIQKFDLDGALIDIWELPGYPSDVEVDNVGLVYISDMSNHKIWIFYSNGDLRNDFGEFGGEPGQLSLPKGLAVEPTSGNVYVADTGNNRVQIFTVDGGFLGGFGSKGEEQGQFKSPEDVLLAPGGGVVLGPVVYVSDSANHRIQHFTLNPVAAPIAQRTLFAAMSFSYSGEFGTRGTGDGQFNLPDGLALDGNGKLYVADYQNDRLQTFGQSVTGGFQHRDSWYDDTRGRFSEPNTLVFGPDGLLYVADPALRQIQTFTPEGDFVDHWRDLPTAGMTFDSQGVLYVTNSDEARVEQYDQDGNLLSAWDPGSSTIFRQGALAADAEDNIYVLHSISANIEKFRPNGDFVRAWGSPGSQVGQFASPADVAVSGDSLYITDRVNHRIQQFDLDGNFIRAWGDADTEPGALKLPWGIAIGPDGYLYVTDHGNHRVVKFTPDGQYVTEWGSEGTGDGQFQGPTGIAVDPDGNVYIADYGNYRIQVFQPVS